MPIITAFGRLREEAHEFETSQNFMSQKRDGRQRQRKKEASVTYKQEIKQTMETIDAF